MNLDISLLNLTLLLLLLLMLWLTMVLFWKVTILSLLFLQILKNAEVFC